MIYVLYLSQFLLWSYNLGVIFVGVKYLRYFLKREYGFYNFMLLYDVPYDPGNYIVVFEHFVRE